MLTDIVTEGVGNSAKFSLSDDKIHETLTTLGAAFEAVAEAEARGDVIAASRLFFAVAAHFYADQPIDAAFDDYHDYLRERGVFLSLRTVVDRLIAGVVAL